MMLEGGCQTQDVRERIGNVRCDIAVSVERDETSSPLAKRLWKTSSLRIVIAIRPRQIEPFFFLNEEYKQSSLWAWLALGIMPTRGAIKRSLLKGRADLKLRKAFRSFKSALPFKRERLIAPRVGIMPSASQAQREDCLYSSFRKKKGSIWRGLMAITMRRLLVFHSLLARGDEVSSRSTETAISQRTFPILSLTSWVWHPPSNIIQDVISNPSLMNHELCSYLKYSFNKE